MPAAYHVDSWDQLGWKDAFGDARWTKHHHEVARALGQTSWYTPELVWDGRGHGLSDAAPEALRKELAAKATATIEADVELSADKLSVKGAFGPVKGGRLDSGLALEVLVLEDDLSTEVARGENGGRTLRETAVVRESRVAKKLDSEARLPVRFETTVDVAASWRRESLHVAVVLREPRTAVVWQALDVAFVGSAP